MKQNKFWSQPAKLLMPATIHPATVTFQHCSPAFHAFIVFVTISYFFLFYPCNSFWFCFFFFGNFLYTEHLYKPQSVQTINHFGNREGGRQFPRCFLFFHFLSFSFPFLSCQTPSEDENSEDGWLDRLSP